MITNFLSGNSAAIVSSGVEKREAHRHHDVGPLRHAPQGLVALALVGDLELEIVEAGLGLELLGAVVGGLVERLVELAAHVEDHGRREVRRLAPNPAHSMPIGRQSPKKRPHRCPTRSCAPSGGR